MSDEKFEKVDFIDDFKKIIVCESIQFVATGIIRILKEEGYFVFHSATGKSAKHLTLQFTPDLVIIPDRLPDINPFDLIQEIRIASNKTRILYTASHDDVRLKQESTRRGADYFLLKPFEKKILLEIIGELLP